MGRTRQAFGPLEPSAAARIAALTGAVGLLYAGVFPELVRDWWNDPNSSHGFLIPLVSLYLIQQRWDDLRRAPVQPALAGAGLLAAGVLALAAGQVGAEYFVQRASLVLVLAGIVWLNLGRAPLRLLLFPILFLLFAIPLPAIVLNALSLPLQLFAARLSTALLHGMAIPVVREGNIIHLAHTSLEVAEACSGLRSLVSLTALSVVLAYFTQPRLAARLVLVASAIPVAIVSNVARLAGTGVLAHHWGEQAARGFYHTFSGWLVFVVAFALLGAEGALLRRLLRPRRRENPR